MVSLDPRRGLLLRLRSAGPGDSLRRAAQDAGAAGARIRRRLAGLPTVGSVVGQVLSWTAICDGKPRLVAEEYWTAADDIPDWGFKLDGRFLVRAIVEGAPDMKLELVIENGAYEGSSGGHVAVAMTAFRAIPYVLKAPGGVVVPEIFGAYRWPATGRR